MNKEPTQHTRKTSLFSISHREKNPESQPQTPSLKPKGSFSSSRGDVTVTSTQKIPEEITPVKLPQETSNTPRLQSSSLKSPNLKQHKRSISDAHLKIHGDKTRDLKSAVSPRLVKERANTLKKLVEPSLLCNQGPTESSMTVTRSRKSSQNQILPETPNESLVKRNSNPESKGKPQDQQEQMKPLKGILFQDVRKRSMINDKTSDTPKSKPSTTQNTPKHSFSSLLAKHKHGDYSPKISARTAAVKDNSPRKRSAAVGWGNEPKKGIKAHDKGLSMGQMYIFSTEVDDKDNKDNKDLKDREDKDTPVNMLQAVFAGNKLSSEKRKTKNTEEDKPKPVAAKNVYERTLESDLANYKIMLDSNKQTFDFEKMMIDRRKARQEQGGAMFTNVADPVVKRQSQPHRKSLDIGGIKNRFMGEACLSAKLVNPSEIEPMSSGNRPATCSTPRVESGKGGNGTGSSTENEDFQKLEKLIEAQEKAGEL